MNQSSNLAWKQAYTVGVILVICSMQFRLIKMCGLVLCEEREFYLKYQYWKIGPEKGKPNIFWEELANSSRKFILRHIQRHTCMWIQLNCKVYIYKHFMVFEWPGDFEWYSRVPIQHFFGNCHDVTTSSLLGRWAWTLYYVSNTKSVLFPVMLWSVLGPKF